MGLLASLTAVASSLHGSEDRFTELDAAAGDGDLGVTAGRIADAIRDAIADLDEPHDGATYRVTVMAVGRSIARNAPSTFGTLVASGVMAAARVMDGLPDGADRLHAALAAAAEEIATRGGADVGERTLLDALVPAVERLARGGTLGDAAEAAEQGAQDTSALAPRHGRAAWIGERVVGTPDAGATVVATALRAAADA